MWAFFLKLSAIGVLATAVALGLSVEAAGQELRTLSGHADSVWSVAFSTPAPTPVGRRVALIVANGAYSEAPLANPSVDAGLIAASLKKVGFAVTVKKDVDLDGFEQALTDFADTTKGADVALFYFVGHGFSTDAGGHQVLLATSANLSAKTAIALQRGGEPLEHVAETIIGHARATLIFVDAGSARIMLRDDPGDRSTRGIDSSSLEGAYVVLSTHVGKTAEDGQPGQGSPFARAFASVLPTPGLRIEDAYYRLREKVRAETSGNQVPDVIRGDLPEGGVVLMSSAEPPASPSVIATAAPTIAPPPEVKPAAPLPTPDAVPDRRVALVIGNSAYPNAALANPVFDADLVSESLRKAGFDVTEVKDADFAKFDAALTRFAAQEEGADIALFYFAGHGFALAGDDLRPRNYLMTTSAEMSATSDAVLRRDGFSIDEVMKRISAPAKVTLAFIDACRNDPFHRGAGDRGFEPLPVSLSRQIYIGMSTHLGKTAIDGVDGKGSPFAQAFVEQMTTPGLRIDDAFRALRKEVSEKTDGKQEPEILQDDLDQGALVLVRSP